MQVEQMFDNIAPKYDLLNRLISGGIDVSWRKKAIQMLSVKSPKSILDVACGTADLALDMLVLQPNEIIGIDISERMLEVGREKIKDKNAQHIITLLQQDVDALTFANEKFDAVTAAFGVRNFEHLELGLTQMYKVMKKGGNLMILELSEPNNTPFKQIYNFHSKFILPFVGKLISKDKSAYTYLPKSIAAFPKAKAFELILNKIGFKNVIIKPLTFGTCTIYFAEK
jgi:demethylmenaquinone methyltransferase/2-methoxy-6-polyprenyl-1,4-benzoquinol methylase